MEKKQRTDLRKTDGGPLYFGLAASILALLSTVMSAGISQAYAASILQKQGLSASYAGATTITSYIMLLIDPGIFLLLLLLAVKKPKRGTAFCVVWIIMGAVSLLSSVYSLINRGAAAELWELADAIMPGGMTIVYIMSTASALCMVACCILLLKRLHTPLPLPDGEPMQDEAAQP
jgi:hypothetical protein